MNICLSLTQKQVFISGWYIFTQQHRYRKFSFEICLMFCPGEKWVEQSSWWTEVQPIPYNLGFFKLRQQEEGTKFYGVSDVCPLAERKSKGRRKGWSVTVDLEFILEFVPAINQRWSEGHKGKKLFMSRDFFPSQINFTHYQFWFCLLCNILIGDLMFRFRFWTP